MRHRRQGRKLGRDASHRKALFSNMAGQLFEHGRFKTTEAKAKELRPIAEKLIALAATRGSSSSARARATPPRWRTSSWWTDTRNTIPLLPMNARLALPEGWT